MSALDDQVAAVKTRIAGAWQARAKAEHEHAVASDALASALAALKSEFGADGLDEARRILTGIEEQVAAECERCGELLDNAGESRD